MNTKHLKSYAPKARSKFMEAVAKRAAHFGIYEDEIAPVSFQGSTAIIEGNAFTKRQGEQRKRLEKQVAAKGFELFIREMAYTWFNRLAALRYMELHDYLEHGFRVLSHPSSKDGLPEILDHATDVADMLALDKAQIIEWQLAGDKQEVLYRELLLGQCHHLHSVMPFLFEAIDDATELLLPDNLTKTDSILKGLVNDIPEEDWEQIEVIGWLYQFYISEHKDAVIGKVVKSEDIPAATQLFTPNWIVKYLVQNSIGRQWLATYPESSIKAKMEYYIEPAEQTEEVNAQLAEIIPSTIDPESIKALDPACGSGHILVEVYELLREIYLERGYRLREIPELILTKNIYGLDIDERAAQLAGFALLMKAREDDRRIFQRVQDSTVKLNVFSLQSTEGWDSASLWQALNLDGKAKKGSSGDLFVETKKFDAPTGEYAEFFDLLKYLIVSFEQAKTLGSLIQIDHQYLKTLQKFKAKLQDKLQETDPAAVAGAEKLLPVVEQSITLAEKYDSVIANPPYMGMGAMNPPLKKYISNNYPESKIDIYGAFILRGIELTSESGRGSFVTMHSWMFVFRFTELREKLLSSSLLETMVHLGSRAFPEISGEVVQTCAFTFQSSNEKVLKDKNKPVFIRAVDADEQSKATCIKNDELRYQNIMQRTYLNFDGKPIIYWVGEDSTKALLSGRAIKCVSEPRHGMVTSDNERFVRYWSEVDHNKIGFQIDCRESSKISEKKWFPYNKGGTPRKWYGNTEFVVNWENDGREIIALATEKYGSPSRKIQSPNFYFKSGITWSSVSMKDIAFRANGTGFLFDSGGSSLFFDDESDIPFYLGILNSSSAEHFVKFLAPTININAGDVARIPLPKAIDIDQRKIVERDVKRAIELFRTEYELLEEHWEFQGLPLKNSPSDSYILERLRAIKKEYRDILDRLDFKVSELFGIEKEVKPRTLYYEFNKIEEKTIGVRYLSYSIGCMMGRYSLDKKGLVYGSSSNKGFNELVEEGEYKTFSPDDDGIIPLASEEWLFEDDATARFREFVKTVWGTEHLQGNLAFVAESLSLDAIKPKKGESSMETIRRYFSEKFFADHCKAYKKRPIYWLFSSGKEKAFECLVYLHRYNEATLSRMRTEYVTPLMGKYDHQLARKMEEVVESTGTEQRRIEKEIKDLEKKQAELRKFDEELKHYAEMRISLDLDDGVKANYGKFGNLLANVKAIHGKAIK